MADESEGRAAADATDGDLEAAARAEHEAENRWAFERTMRGDFTGVTPYASILKRLHEERAEARREPLTRILCVSASLRRKESFLHG